MGMNDPVLRFLGILAVTGIALATIRQLASSSAPSTAPATGLRTERRGTPEHRDPNGRSKFGFSPVKATHPNEET